jgi:hypothetical protein
VLDVCGDDLAILDSVRAGVVLDLPGTRVGRGKIEGHLIS